MSAGEALVARASHAARSGSGHARRFSGRMDHPDHRGCRGHS